MNTQGEYRFTIEWAGETPEAAETRAMRLLQFMTDNMEQLVEILGRDTIPGSFDYRIHCLECDAIAGSFDELEHEPFCT